MYRSKSAAAAFRRLAVDAEQVYAAARIIPLGKLFGDNQHVFRNDRDVRLEQALKVARSRMPRFANDVSGSCSMDCPVRRNSGIAADYSRRPDERNGSHAGSISPALVR